MSLPLQTVQTIVDMFNQGATEFSLALVRVPFAKDTVNSMADRLAQGQSVLCRSGARGGLIGECKARQLFTHSTRQPDGSYLFTPCAPRPFKS